MNSKQPLCDCGRPSIKQLSCKDWVCAKCLRANHHQQERVKRHYKHDPEFGSEEEWLRAFRRFWRDRGMTEPVENFKDAVYAEMNGSR